VPNLPLVGVRQGKMGDYFRTSLSWAKFRLLIP
jgi:hypothetical protein